MLKGPKVVNLIRISVVNIFNTVPPAIDIKTVFTRPFPSRAVLTSDAIPNRGTEKDRILRYGAPKTAELESNKQPNISPGIKSMHINDGIHINVIKGSPGLYF